MSEHDETDELFSTPSIHKNQSILERVAIHPLASEDEESRASSSINASSLIESAARSILDDKSPSTALSDDQSCADGAFRREQLSPTLQSLQRETLPAIPDEQDRKRFVGCLAAILACTYDYDAAEESDDLNDATMAENMAYLSMSEHDENQFGDHDDDDPSLFHTVGGSFEYSDISETVDADSSKHRTSQANVRRGTRQKGIQARNRHRKRRYDVLSNLLLDSSEYLMLEKSQAKAFLPMLSKLLVPESKERQGSRRERRPPIWQRTPSKSKQGSHNGASQAMLERISGAPVDDFGASRDILTREMDEIEYLRPFLESMTPGAGFRCVSLLLLQYLLHSQEGYDARIRYAVRTLGVLALAHDMEMNPVESHAEIAETTSNRKKNGLSRPDLVALASRKFESLEHSIAAKLIVLSREQEKVQSGRRAPARKNNNNESLERQPKGYSKEKIMRGIKVGGAGLVAGTLFAFSGGLAAPVIASGVAAFAGGVAASATAILTSTAAVTAIFGVGGGSLAAYKMQRRTQGLTEFEFRKECGQSGRSSKEGATPVEAELFSTICLSGWLRDEFDFQRPWGVNPSHPPLTSRLELLERFYSVHSPDHVAKSSRILASWKGEENELWNLLRQKYGRDPDHLFPLDDGIRYRGGLTLEQEEILDQLFVELGFSSSPKGKGQPTPFERMRVGWKKRFHHTPEQQGARSGIDTPQTAGIGPDFRDSLHGPHINDDALSGSLPGSSSVASSGFESGSTAVSAAVDGREDFQDKVKPPKHLATVWDYQANYGGELYTVRWESGILSELCDSVSDLAFDVVSGGTAQILRHTALSTLMSAFAWPLALVNAANMIDGTWTLAVERSDEAGKELARSLLFSRAGHRPVTLVGFSFGARTIYSCLKELARYQEKWEDYHERNGTYPLTGSELVEPTSEGSDDFFRYMREPASIVEDAILMGLPNHLSLSSWGVCRQVVAGRLVNCFSQKDLILSLMFQFKRLGIKPVCGTCPVSVPGVENFDVTDLVRGHQDYCLVTGKILQRVRHCQPFRSRPTRVFVPDLNVDDGSRDVEKYDL